MTIRHEIEKQVAALMVADADFATITKFKIGIQWRIPLHDYPLCEIVITEGIAISEETGVKTMQYIGTIRFEVISVDTLTSVAARTEAVDSYIEVDGYVSAAVDLFRTKANQTLNSLSGLSPDWAVNNFELEGSVLFGFGQREERSDNWQMFGALPFICETREIKV